MRLSTATIIPLLVAGVAFTGAVPAMADPQPGPTPPTTGIGTMPQPGPIPSAPGTGSSAMPQPGPTPPTTGTGTMPLPGPNPLTTGTGSMPQPGPPTPPTTGIMPQPGTASGSDNGGRVGHGQDNGFGFGFGGVRPGHGFGDRNHIHHFRLHQHHRSCFFVHRHVVIRIIRFDGHRVVIVKTIVPGHLVCLTPFRDF